MLFDSFDLISRIKSSHLPMTSFLGHRGVASICDRGESGDLSLSLSLSLSLGLSLSLSLSWSWG